MRSLIRILFYYNNDSGLKFSLKISDKNRDFTLFNRFGVFNRRGHEYSGLSKPYEDSRRRRVHSGYHTAIACKRHGFSHQTL